MDHVDSRLAIHSTHKAARKIAGIGAVLDGLLPEPAYLKAFPQTLLAGAFPLTGEPSPLPETLFDSKNYREDEEWSAALMKVATESGTRIIFGRRKVGSVLADVLLCSPDGISRETVDKFARYVADNFEFDLSQYEEKYVALNSDPDVFLERLLEFYENDSLRPWPAPEKRP